MKAYLQKYETSYEGSRFPKHYVFEPNNEKIKCPDIEKYCSIQWTYQQAGNGASMRGTDLIKLDLNRNIKSVNKSGSKKSPQWW